MSIDSNQYRFEGYQLPKIQLSAGFDVYYMGVHPYFFNQPLYWTQQATKGNSYPFYEVVEANYPIQPPASASASVAATDLPSSSSDIVCSTGLETIGNEPQEKQSHNFKLLPI